MWKMFINKLTYISVILWNPLVLHALENLAFNKTTSQSTTYHDNRTSDKVVDGNRNSDMFQNSCTHTASDRRTAWWRVDLGLMARIDHIYFVYRKTWPSRLAGFTLYVSNETNWENGKICFQHSEAKLPSYIMNITCQHTARYVTFYNDRIGVQPSTYSLTAIVELCELEVYGCPVNKFGSVCQETCQCDGCDPVTGICDTIVCDPGWQGDSCEKVCDYQTFGQECQGRCFCMIGNCSPETGICDNVGCQHGWKGDNCTTACEGNTFGPDCSKICHCKVGGCDRFKGICSTPGDCKPGWQGESCSQRCSGTFGTNCTGICGNCVGSDNCNPVTGFCEFGCKPGWLEPYCNKCINGRFGKNCEKICIESEVATTNIQVIALGCALGIVAVSHIITCCFFIRSRREKHFNLSKSTSSERFSNAYQNRAYNEDSGFNFYDDLSEDKDKNQQIAVIS